MNVNRSVSVSTDKVSSAQRACEFAATLGVLITTYAGTLGVLELAVTLGWAA